LYKFYEHIGPDVIQILKKINILWESVSSFELIIWANLMIHSMG
jgi:hypothetical protein